MEKRIERVREKEKSVLYKATIPQEQLQRQRQNRYERDEPAAGREQQQKYEKASMLSDQETATIESQLSAEQLQLFAEENDMMLRHYEDTLSKVQFVALSHIHTYIYILINCIGTQKNPSSKSPPSSKPSSRTCRLKKNSSLNLSLMHPPRPRMSARETKNSSAQTSARVRRRWCFGARPGCVCG